MIKPNLPDSPLPALLDHDGRFQALFPEDLVRQHGEDMPEIRNWRWTKIG